MRFPLSLYASLSASFARNALAGRTRFPLVLMLEPTHRCNLACSGCDRVRLYEQENTPDLSLPECMEAVYQSRAPVVTVTGGEPMLYGDLTILVGELLRLKRFVYLCSNGTLTQAFIERCSPDSRLTLNFHLDGMREFHDELTRPGTFNAVAASIKAAKRKGFRVSTNTSVYRNSDPAELEKLFSFLMTLGVDGFLIAPAFRYERVAEDIFLSREQTVDRFRRMDFLDRFPFMNSPLYLDFLRGARQMPCTPWGNPTRNPLGWKSPCYLITDAYFASFSELMNKTDWDRFESGADPRCRDCMVHSGYEATVQRMAFSRPKDMLRLTMWNIRSKR